MIYTRLIPIEFNHCDPAGIVFYPRYFEMTNSVVENFFADVAGRSFAAMSSAAPINGVPTVRIAAEFVAPSRLGDKVLFSLRISQLGSRSAAFELEAAADGERRMRATITLVWTAGHRSAPWPDEVRARMAAYKEAQDAA
jgi:4-hydroxybenzoyl-CoA thioesterase